MADLLQAIPVITVLAFLHQAIHYCYRRWYL